jgi:hypothetical protein
MIKSKYFYINKRTEPILKRIERHIAVSPSLKTIELRRVDFDILKANHIIPIIRHIDTLDYRDGYQLRGGK